MQLDSENGKKVVKRALFRGNLRKSVGVTRVFSLLFQNGRITTGSSFKLGTMSCINMVSKVK